MIKEYAFGINKRHHFHDANKYGEFMGLHHDTYCSLYDYDKSVVEYYSQNKSLSGFDGLIYIPKEFLLDIYGKNIEDAQKKTLSLISLLEKKGVFVFTCMQLL